MNKEILEITKKFHDTYEKLASEYTYETREDTKVFDINSNNGKLMYATVNEIVSPILEENQELKSQLKGTTHCFDEEEHEKLKKQLEKLQEEYIEFQEKASDIQFELRDDRDNYYERLQAKYREQKEFIKWLEDYLNLFDYRDIEEQAGYDMLEEILQKYRSIIGVSDEKK